MLMYTGENNSGMKFLKDDYIYTYNIYTYKGYSIS